MADNKFIIWREYITKVFLMIERSTPEMQNSGRHKTGIGHASVCHLCGTRTGPRFTSVNWGAADKIHHILTYSFSLCLNKLPQINCGISYFLNSDIKLKVIIFTLIN